MGTDGRCSVRALDLYIDLAERGMSLTTNGGNLRVQPRGLLTDEDRLALREVKPDMLAIVECADRAGTSAAETCYLTIWELAKQYGAERIGLGDDADDNERLAMAHVLAGQIAAQVALGHFPGGRRIQRGGAP